MSETIGRPTALSPAIALGALATASIALAAGVTPALVPLVGGAIALAAWHQHLLAWRSLLAITVVVVLFIPIRRYTLSSGLPFQLEPYRVVVAVVIVAWACSLLIDPRVRLRRTGFDGPLLAFSLAIATSLALNAGRAATVAPVLTKKLVFFATFALVLYIVVSVVRRTDAVERLVAVTVGGGTVVAALAIVESRTGFNAFDLLPRAMPFLQEHQVFEVNASTDGRGARTRALGSSQSPIALGAAFVMLLPLALALACGTRRTRWWVALAVLATGTFATVSRTPLVMLVAVAVVLVWLRARELRRSWPALLPLLVVVHFAVPGAIGSVARAFTPEGGLIAQQSNTAVGSGRLATAGPALRSEWLPNPLLGEGFATRVATVEDEGVAPNGPILDNQWLGVLLETGLVGAVALLWLFGRVIRRLGALAKDDRSLRGWLACGLAASVAAYGVGMFVFDAFSFIQVTFLLFVFVGLGSALAASGPGARPLPAATR